MSKAVGKPVRVQWMRPDEHVWEHYGTPMVMKLKGGLDARGNLVAWDYEGWQAARGGRPGNVGAANLPTGYLDGLRLPPRQTTTPRLLALGADSSNTEAGYLLDEDGLVKNARVIAHTVDSQFFTDRCARRPGSRTRSPTRASSTSSRRQRRPTRSSSGSATSATRGSRMRSRSRPRPPAGRRGRRRSPRRRATSRPGGDRRHAVRGKRRLRRDRGRRRGQQADREGG